MKHFEQMNIEWISLSDDEHDDEDDDEESGKEDNEEDEETSPLNLSRTTLDKKKVETDRKRN